MRAKGGVILAGLDIAMRPALIEAERIWEEMGYHLTVTSALDGVHSAGSLHYYGRALDFRTRDMGKARMKAYLQLKERLPRGFDVVLEHDHIHVEWDPKEG